jgi:Fe-S cluster assembly scaffold protein SufB
MIHVGKNTRSRIVSKGISAGNSVNAYRGLVQVQPTARGECVLAVLRTGGGGGGGA